MFKRFQNTLSSTRGQILRSRTRRELLGKSDHVLADMGLSREALLLGNEAFPWRVETLAQPIGAGRSVAPARAPSAFAAVPTNVLSMTLATAVLASGEPEHRKAA